MLKAAEACECDGHIRLAHTGVAAGVPLPEEAVLMPKRLRITLDGRVVRLEHGQHPSMTPQPHAMGRLAEVGVASTSPVVAFTVAPGDGGALEAFGAFL